MTKLAIIPFTVLLETVFLKKQFRFFFSFYIAITLLIASWAFWDSKLAKTFCSTLCSQKIKLSLFLLLVGVGIASITDLQLNFVGTILSLLAIATTCVGQIVSFLLSLLSAYSWFVKNWGCINWSSIYLTKPYCKEIKFNMEKCFWNDLEDSILKIYQGMLHGI